MCAISHLVINALTTTPTAIATAVISHLIVFVFGCESVFC